MPKGVSEISQGNQFSRSANEGQLADAATRTFRIILNSTDEVFDIQAVCGVSVGDAHPTNTNIACTSFDAKYDGDSRTVLVATFNYASEAASSPSFSGGSGGSPKTLSPEVRPAKYSISTEVSEAPLKAWKLKTQPFPNAEWAADWHAAVNPAGDYYEGLTGFVPLTTIKVTQFLLGGDTDPTSHSMFVGSINSQPITSLGSLYIHPHTLMLRSVSATPAVESWGRFVKVGWNAEYTFMYKNTPAKINYGNPGTGYRVADSKFEYIGWDVPVVVEGRNVICGDPAAASAWQDPYGIPLKKGEDGAVEDPAALERAPNVAFGSRQRANVSTAVTPRALSQAVASQPVALNDDGTPRKIVPGTYEPLVWAYQIYNAVDLVKELRLRLY